MAEPWFQFFRDKPRPGVLISLGVGVLVVALAIYLAFFRQAYVALAQDVRPGQAAAIVAAFEESGMGFRLADEGRTILVPNNRLSEARLLIASPEIAPVGLNGFELFDESSMGMTEFAQQVKYQRALQGEIVRTLLMLHDIADVRVHISIPEQGLFRDADARASAAVTLVTRSGNPLEAGRVEGVQRLVSAAVPRLPVENVVILDAAGTIVSPTPLPEELPATELELASATTAPTEEGVPGDALPIEANADAAPDNGVNASVEDSSAEADAPAAPETALTAQSELTDQPPVLLAAPDRPSTRWQDLGWQDVSQAEGVSTTPLSDQLAAESVSPGLLQSVSRLGPQIIWLVIVSLVIVLMILIYRRLQRPTLADIELEALVDRLKARLRAPQDEALGGDPGNQALSTFAALAPADQRAVRARLEPFEQSMLDYAGREAPASAAPTQIAQGRTRFSDVLQDRIQAATGSKPSDGSKMTARARAALRAAAEATAPAKPREEAAS